MLHAQIICKNCKQSFKLESKDISFRFDTICPHCNYQLKGIELNTKQQLEHLLMPVAVRTL